MTKEALFAAIGYVEESRLARSELRLQEPSGEIPTEERNMRKKKINMGRLLRNLLAAVMILSMLGVTAYAVAGWVIFDSPEEMISAVFGDKTGYDHKPVTTWTDPEKPGSLYQNPAHDRVPAETEAVAEVAPHVTSVGKTLTRDGYTLTVDAYLYDSATASGIVTYTLESETGLPEYGVQPDGEFWFPGIPDPVDFNQYGKTFLIQEKTTEKHLAAIYYFHYDAAHNPDFTVALGDTTELSEEERVRLNAQCEEAVRQRYTPEAAIAEAKKQLGGAWFEQFRGSRTEEEAAYAHLASRLCREKADTREKISFDCSDANTLDRVTLGGGAVIITPISFQIDVEDLAFLHETIDGAPYIHADNVKSVVICYRDGTEYVVTDAEVRNVVFALGSVPKDSETGRHSRLNYMFNRVIDLDQVASLRINGSVLTLD